MTNSSDDHNTQLISSAHPSLPGHFPGHPIVPGVVILNSIFGKLSEAFPEWRPAGIRKLKFLQPLLPEQKFSIEFGAIKSDKLRFKCRLSSDQTLLAEGNVKLCRHTA